MDTPNRPVIAVFRSDLRRVTALLAIMGGGFGLLVFGAEMFFAWRSGKAPNWPSVLENSLFMPALFGLFWLLCRFLQAVYPVKILGGALRCYDLMGTYATIPWRDIREIGRIEQYGLAYLTFQVEGRFAPVTLPLWLENMPEFVRQVERQAGRDHVLVTTLKNELGMA